jgi:starvation-inducible DNA-binding protein
MKRSKNELPSEIRAASVKLLGARLVDGVDLQLQSKQAHWNVKGPSFAALHEVFDKLCADVETYVDLVAARIVQLGGYVDGSARTVAKSSSLTEFPRVQSGREHVDALAIALSAFGARARAAIDEAQRAGDGDTAELFTEISRGIDRWVWFVESHLNLN